jgi:tetratricopeptide (TPR) repeat protein
MSATNPLNLASERLSRWFPLTLVALGILAWSNVFACAFIFDDKIMITGNARLHHLWPPWDAVTVPTRWVVDLSFALNHAISGFNPADFHLTNLAIHIVAGLLLYGLVRRTLRLPALADRFGAQAALLGFLVAALWLVHPLQTESVTYIVQRMESLMGAFYLAVFYTFVRSFDSLRPDSWRGLAWGLCLLGMGTKEIMVTVPPLLILFDATFVADGWGDAVRRRWRIHAAMLATLAGFVALFYWGVVRARSHGDVFYDASARWSYLLTQPQALLLYLRMTVIPWPLCLDYKWPLVETWRQVLWQAPLVASMAAFSAYGACRRQPWAFCSAWFFVILAPTSSLIPLQDVVFEHRMYLPLAGALAFAIVGTGSLAAHLPAGRACALRWAGGTLLGLAIPVLASLSWVRNQDYRTEETMWRDVIRKRPDNYRAYVACSTAFLQDHRTVEAMRMSQAALARLPDYTGIPYDELMRLRRAHQNMPIAEYAMLRNNLGAAYLALDRHAEALAQFREAVRVLPQAAWAHSNVAKALYFAGEVKAAIDTWRVALSIAPRDSQTLTFLAIALVAQGQDREAAEKYRAALRSNPGDAFVRAQLAWMLATHPDDAIRNGRDAVTVAEPLVTMAQGLSARALDVLAAAYAEAGHIEAAVRTAEQALALAKGEQNSGMPAPALLPSTRPAAATTDTSIMDMQQRLDLYRAGKPYRTAAAPDGRK